MKFYFWDTHKYLPKLLPTNVEKEYIYHFSNNDSVLEKEIIYDASNRPIIIKQYAVPSKGELIETDSLFYNKNGLLETEINLKQGFYGSIDTTIIKYSYDKEKREVSKVSSEKNLSNRWFTSYETDSSGKKIVTYRELWYSTEIEREIHFLGKSDNEDSIQLYANGKWFRTTEFKYDTSSHTTNIYFRYFDYTTLVGKINFNDQQLPVYVLRRTLPNWNKTKIYDIEISQLYYPRGYTRECEYIIKGKKRYSKKHYYSYKK